MAKFVEDLALEKDKMFICAFFASGLCNLALPRKPHTPQKPPRGSSPSWGCRISSPSKLPGASGLPSGMPSTHERNIGAPGLKGRHRFDVLFDDGVAIHHDLAPLGQRPALLPCLHQLPDPVRAPQLPLLGEGHHLPGPVVAEIKGYVLEGVLCRVCRLLDQVRDQVAQVALVLGLGLKLLARHLDHVRRGVVAHSRQFDEFVALLLLPLQLLRGERGGGGWEDIPGAEFDDNLFGCRVVLSHVSCVAESEWAG